MTFAVRVSTDAFGEALLIIGMGVGGTASSEDPHAVRTPAAAITEHANARVRREVEPVIERRLGIGEASRCVMKTAVCCLF
jgi:hypothetical protein